MPKGAVVVSDGVDRVDSKEVVQSDEVVEKVAEFEGEALVGIAADSSVLDEAVVADALEGSAETGNEARESSDSEVVKLTEETDVTRDELQDFPDVMVLTEGSDERDKLVKAIRSDHSLMPFIKLGKKLQNGFRASELPVPRHLITTV